MKYAWRKHGIPYFHKRRFLLMVSRVMRFGLVFSLGVSPHVHKITICEDFGSICLRSCKKTMKQKLLYFGVLLYSFFFSLIIFSTLVSKRYQKVRPVKWAHCFVKKSKWRDRLPFFQNMKLFSLFSWSLANLYNSIYFDNFNNNQQATHWYGTSY